MSREPLREREKLELQPYRRVTTIQLLPAGISGYREAISCGKHIMADEESIIHTTRRFERV